MMIVQTQHNLGDMNCMLGLRDLNRYTGDGGKQKIKIRLGHPVVVRLITAILNCIIKTRGNNKAHI
jgi:hypothetical protein